MRGRRLSLTAAIVVLGALVFTTGAQACSCARMAPGEALRRADAAIVGELVAVVPRDNLRADYRYRVQRVYKGGQAIRPGLTISVRSASESAACGLPDRTGRRYGLLLDAPSIAEPVDAERGAVQGGPWVGGLCGIVAPRKLRLAAQQPPTAERRGSGSESGSDCAS